MLQHPLVQLVIQDAIKNLKSSILFADAFPNVAVGIRFARSALTSAAIGQLLVASLAANDIHTQLTQDDTYCTNTTKFSVTHHSALRKEVVRALVTGHKLF